MVLRCAGVAACSVAASGDLLCVCVCVCVHVCVCARSLAWVTKVSRAYDRPLPVVASRVCGGARGARVSKRKREGEGNRMRPTDTHTEKDGEGSRGGGGREKERRPGSKSQLLLQLRHNVWVTVCAHIRVSILTYTHDDTRERARAHTQHACVSVHENSHFNFGQAEAGMSFMHSLLELLHLVLLLLHSRFKLFLRLALPKMEKALKTKKTHWSARCRHTSMLTITSHHL